MKKCDNYCQTDSKKLTGYGLIKGQKVFLRCVVSDIKDNCVIAVRPNEMGFPSADFNVHRNDIVESTNSEPIKTFTTQEVQSAINGVPTKEDGNTCNMRDVKRVLLDNGLIPTPVSNDEAPATSPIETFTTQEVQYAISYFLEYGEMQFGKSQCGYFSGDGWAARALRFHLGRLKSDNRKCDEPNAQEL